MAREKVSIKFYDSSSNITITETSIISLKITQSCDLSGSSAPYSTLTCRAYAPTVAAMGMYTKLEVYTNLKTIGTFYTTSMIKNEYLDITAVSALGVLSNEPINGVSFYTGMLTTTLINNIVGSEFVIDTTPFSPMMHLYSFGWIIDGGNKRTALANIAQAHAYWLTPDIEFKAFDTTSTPIVIPASRVYLTPSVVQETQTNNLTIYAYDTAPNDDGFNITAGQRDYNIYARNTEQSVNPVTGSKKDVEITNYAIPNSYRNQPMYEAVIDTLPQYYARSRVWEGKVLWNTATNECRLGQRVTVPLANGQSVTGNVIQSNLNFSGASVASSMKVLLET